MVLLIVGAYLIIAREGRISKMVSELMTRVAELVELGWTLTSQTETTAGLETRRPINWWILALSILLLFGLGALLYLAYWLVASRAHIFLAVKDGVLVPSGDLWLVEQQERERERSIQRAQEIKQRGFWRVMWPAVLAWIGIVVLWFVMIWAFIKLAT